MDINFLIPPHPPLQKQEKIRFYLDALPFQTKIYSNSIVQTLFNEYKNLYWKYKIIIATDASKSNENCSIASKNFTTGVTKAGSVSNYNSIFTSEVLAILIAINNLINDNQHYRRYSPNSVLASESSNPGPSVDSGFREILIPEQELLDLSVSEPT
ncbi:hypothetical protein AVEN_161659-1 [Araneus ventricosus]|uniref:RNase H type-1 domain-containing protein n=1 Tax=Araneus ventricosus TaxID=182803 RepID=A0A4Y2JJP6_ARAVE|nr:hypothetical protein AVEN_161659-1 [Araneus ventricosus]